MPDFHAAMGGHGIEKTRAAEDGPILYPNHSECMPRFGFANCEIEPRIECRSETGRNVELPNPLVLGGKPERFAVVLREGFEANRCASENFY